MQESIEKKKRGGLASLLRRNAAHMPGMPFGNKNKTKSSLMSLLKANRAKSSESASNTKVIPVSKDQEDTKDGKEPVLRPPSPTGAELAESTKEASKERKEEDSDFNANISESDSGIGDGHEGNPPL